MSLAEVALMIGPPLLACLYCIWRRPHKDLDNFMLAYWLAFSCLLGIAIVVGAV